MNTLTKPMMVPDADVDTRQFYWKDVIGMAELSGIDTKKDGQPLVIDALQTGFRHYSCYYFQNYYFFNF